MSMSDIFLDIVITKFDVLTDKMAMLVRGALETLAHSI